MAGLPRTSEPGGISPWTTAPDPLDFAVIGRCEEGEGVLLLHDGEPAELRGYEHFTQE